MTSNSKSKKQSAVEDAIIKDNRSEAMKGNNYCLGRKLSEETKRKISEALKGHAPPKSALRKAIFLGQKERRRKIEKWEFPYPIQHLQNYLYKSNPQQHPQLE